MIKSDFAYKVYENTIDVNNFIIDLMPSVTLGDGTTRSDNGQLLFSQVGVDKLYSSEYISDYDFTAGLVAIYHENRHVEQLRDIHESTEEYTKPLKYSYYATMCCPEYNNLAYNEFNYFHCPREIEAELYGMFGAYQTCYGLYGRDRADELLINYTNEKVANGVAFVNRKSNFRYSNVDDIFDDMSDAYGESIYGKREYIPSKDENNLANWCFHKNPGLFVVFNKADEGWQMDRMLASLY